MVPSLKAAGLRHSACALGHGLGTPKCMVCAWSVRGLRVVCSFSLKGAFACAIRSDSPPSPGFLGASIRRYCAGFRFTDFSMSRLFWYTEEAAITPLLKQIAGKVVFIQFTVIFINSVNMLLPKFLYIRFQG